MFIVKKLSTNEMFVWGNEKKDDFIRFIPANLGTTQADIKVYLLPCASHNDCDLHNRTLIADEDNGQIIAKVYDSASYDEQTQQPVFGNLITQYSATEIQWPYDQDMNFLGNGHELGD